MNEETYALFDRYLLGNLSAEEQLAFEKELPGNEPMRNELEFLQAAMGAIKMNGKSILKKQLAEIGAGISASEFEKYSPSVKPKSFFRKWWWIIAIIAVAAAIILGWNLRPESSSPENKADAIISEAPETEAIAINTKTLSADSAKPDSLFTVPVQNSHDLKQDLKTVVDSAILISPKKGFINTNIEQKVTDESNCRSYAVKLLPKQSFAWIENLKDYKKQNADYRFTDISGTTIVMVECCGQTNNPSYSFESSISLLSYADTTGLRFYADGNSVIMTDGKPGYFILARGQKEQPLRRLNGSTFYDVTDKDTVKTSLPQDR